MSLYLGDQIIADIPDLSHKADNSAVVHKTGNEEIAGMKTFLNKMVLGDTTTNLGAIELYGGNKNYGGYLDFHFKDSDADYTSRIIESAEGKLNFIASNGLQLNNKNLVFITETWRSGNNWYRVWSDGWIEQGGKGFGLSNAATITFNKSFTTTEYTLVTGAGNNTSTSKHEGHVNTYNRTKTSFQMWWMSASANCMEWYACGF